MGIPNPIQFFRDVSRTRKRASSLQQLNSYIVYAFRDPTACDMKINSFAALSIVVIPKAISGR